MNSSMIDVLRAHLAKQGLVVCKATSGFPLAPVDGLEEHCALLGIVEVVDDARNVAEWDAAEVTTPVHQDVMYALARAS